MGHANNNGKAESDTWWKTHNWLKEYYFVSKNVVVAIAWSRTTLLVKIYPKLYLSKKSTNIQ